MNIDDNKAISNSGYDSEIIFCITIVENFETDNV